VLLATARTEVADILSSILYVYGIIIFIYIIVQLLFNAGIRPPYSRTSSSILQFLHDVCEPYLRVFRRFLPGVGGWDFSPILALLTLYVVNRVIVLDLIHG